MSKPATVADARRALCLVSRSAQGWDEAEGVKLLKLCLADKDPAVRAAAVSALDREDWKGPAVELLVATLKDESEKVRASAGSILVGRGDQRGLAAVLAGALSKDVAVRDDCSQIIPGLIAAEEGQPQHPRFKHTAEEVAVLGKLLALEDMNSRGTVARLLGMIGDKSAGPALLEALGKESAPKNRRRIANSLALLRHRPAAAALVELLKARQEKLRGEKQDYGWGVAGSWARIGDPDSVPAMIALLGDEKLAPYATAGLSWAFGMDGIDEDYARGGGPGETLVPSADGKFNKQSADKAPKADELKKLWEGFWSAGKDTYKWSEEASTMRLGTAKGEEKK
jgi:HEAT repeat protein